MTDYPSALMDMLFIVVLGLNTWRTWRREPLDLRVRRLELWRSEIDVALRRVPAEVGEMHRLMEQTLSHHQEWLAELKVDIIESNEATRRDVADALGRLACLRVVDSVIPCAKEG